MTDLTTQIDEVEGELLSFAGIFLKSNLDNEVEEMLNEHMQGAFDNSRSYSTEEIESYLDLVLQKLAKRSYPI